MTLTSFNFPCTSTNKHLSRCYHTYYHNAITCPITSQKSIIYCRNQTNPAKTHTWTHKRLCTQPQQAGIGTFQYENHDLDNHKVMILKYSTSDNKYDRLIQEQTFISMFDCVISGLNGDLSLMANHKSKIFV